MSITKTLVYVAIATLAVSILLFTRFGVFVVFDVLGDLTQTDNVATDPSDGPLTLDRMLYHSDAIPLPSALQQPSGIDATAVQLFISTDQAELFELTSTGTLQNQTDLLSGPLLFKQGSLESIVLVQDDEPEVWAIGELGALAQWRWTRGGWARLDDVPLPQGYDEAEFTGLTRLDGTLFATTERLGVINLSTGSALELDVASRLKPGRSEEEIMLSGLSHDGERLVLITENYTSLIFVDIPSATIVAVVGIDAGEASDVVMLGGQAYVTVDHNLFDDHPPLFVYDVEIGARSEVPGS